MWEKYSRRVQQIGSKTPLRCYWSTIIVIIGVELISNNWHINNTAKWLFGVICTEIIDNFRNFHWSYSTAIIDSLIQTIIY